MALRPAGSGGTGAGPLKGGGTGTAKDQRPEEGAGRNGRGTELKRPRTGGGSAPGPGRQRRGGELVPRRAGQKRARTGTLGPALGEEAAGRNGAGPAGGAGPVGASPSAVLTVAILVHGEVLAARLMQIQHVRHLAAPAAAAAAGHAGKRAGSAATTLGRERDGRDGAAILGR